MRVIPIREVTLDPSGRVRIAPALPADKNYDLIYRAAMSVRWDPRTRTLYTLPVPEWTPLDEFRQILAAAENEYGDRLVTNPQTRFVNLPPELETEMRSHTK